MAPASLSKGDTASGTANSRENVRPVRYVKRNLGDSKIFEAKREAVDRVASTN